MQTIYYPGFTLGGIAEFGSIVAALVLVILTPSGRPIVILVATGDEHEG